MVKWHLYGTCCWCDPGNCVLLSLTLFCFGLFKLSNSIYPIRFKGLNYTDLSGVDKYFCFWNFFSRPISCSSVKIVRLRRGFFRRGVLRSVSDSLLMLSGVWLGDGSEPRGCCGESNGRCEWAVPGEDGCGTWAVRLEGCRVITDRSG